MIGMLIRFDRNPGETPEWLGNVLIVVIIATFISLTMIVHVVDTIGQDQMTFISLFSNTPGNLNMEAEQIKERFKCGKDNKIDFVSFEAKYSCVTKKDAEVGWDKHNIPVLRVINDKGRDERRVIAVSMDT